MTAAQLLSADLSNDGAIKLRGFLDVGTPDEGFKGWIVDVSDPKRKLSVELCADAAVVAETLANQERADFRQSGPDWRRVGFQFASRDVQALIVDRGVPPDARLWVRVAGTGFSLRSSGPVSSPADFLAAAEERAGGGRADGPDPALSPAVARLERIARDASFAARDLPSALQAMAAQAADLLRLPLTPSSEKIAGHIECLSSDQEGLVWVFGWMKRRLPLIAPVVIVDGAKYPSALIAATHERGDLPEDAVGIVGLLRTGWRPSRRGGAPLLFLGAAAEACLPLLEAPTLFTAGECAARVEALKPDLEGPFAKPLLQTFGAISNWVPDNGRLTGAGVAASADSVLILPGFGCLVEGWALSPLHAVEGFMLRVGKSVLTAERRSLGSKPRPDLLAFAPNAEGMVEAGGFVAAFPGQVGESDRGDVVLKVVCEGGLSTNHAVSPDAVRVLGGSAPFDEVLRLFPSARAEAFFPELARCVSEELRRLSSKPVGFEVREAEGALVVAVPDDESDMALLFSDLSVVAQRRGRLPPLVALARPGRHRPAVLSLFDDARRNLAGASSLFFVPDPAYAVYVLGEALGQVGAARFAFVAPGVFPTDAGWDALLDRLEDGGEDLVFLPVEGFADGPAPADAAAPRADCFAWNRPALAAWLERTPLFISGSSGRALTLPSGAAPAAPGASAKRGRRPAHSVLATWVNEALSERSAGSAHA